MELRFSSIDQAKSVRDVIEHRVLAITEIVQLPELELDEAMDLVAVLHRLHALISRESEE